MKPAPDPRRLPEDPNRLSPRRPVKNKKPFVIEWRYIGKTSLFEDSREWGPYQRYRTKDGAEQALAKLQRDRAWKRNWEFRMGPLP